MVQVTDLAWDSVVEANPRRLRDATPPKNNPIPPLPGLSAVSGAVSQILCADDVSVSRDGEVTLPG